MGSPVSHHLHLKAFGKILGYPLLAAWCKTDYPSSSLTSTSQKPRRILVMFSYPSFDATCSAVRLSLSSGRSQTCCKEGLTASAIDSRLSCCSFTAHPRERVDGKVSLKLVARFSNFSQTNDRLDICFICTPQFLMAWLREFVLSSIRNQSCAEHAD